MLVPVWHPTSCLSNTFPASTVILYPVSWLSVLDVSSTFAIAAILANASPLNP